MCYFWEDIFQHTTPVEFIQKKMTQEEIFNKIGNILAELNQEYTYLAAHNHQFNDLEVELFLANAHFLKDHVRIFQKLNNNKNQSVTPDVQESTVNSSAETELEHLSPENDNEQESAALEAVVTAERENERVDLEPKEEIIEKEPNAEKVVLPKEENFFKPDIEERSFEFELEKVNHARAGVEEQNLEATLPQYDLIADDEADLPALLQEAVIDDEIGPEPFLLNCELEETEEMPEPVVVIDKPKQETKESIKFTAPLSTEYNERQGIDLQSGSSAVGSIPSFSPEVVRTEPLASIFEKKDERTLNDLLAKKTGQPETGKKAPITDLKHAINLNEKMLFIKELFGGYNMAYSEALDLVNKMTTFENAENFLRNNYAAKNNWVGKQQTVDQFYEILHRRFDK